MSDSLQQPYSYQYREAREPDPHRLPGWRDVTAAEWNCVQWQRTHCVKNIGQLRALTGNLLSDSFFADLERDQKERATMSLLITPHMINTVAPDAPPRGPGSLTDAFYADPVRRYMLPVFSDRRTDFPSHPYAQRDSLHERNMWAVEGLVHRYPAKVLAELVATCPQYCGHCTRMDLVGNSTPSVTKTRFVLTPQARFQAMIDYLRRTPNVRDVVVSGGDLANLPWPRVESFVEALLDIASVRDIRLASKGLVGLPQHWTDGQVLAGIERLTSTARSRGVQIALHTHANAAQQITASVSRASRLLMEAGLREVRNQAVLLRTVNDTSAALLDLCFALLDSAGIVPYYFYMCDMIPNSEHWRTSVAEAQELQHAIMGYLPGFATPRIVCDVPMVGKRWVDQVSDYDRRRGISYWSKNYRTILDQGQRDDLTQLHEYYDPIYTLPADGQRWWRSHASVVASTGCARTAPAECQPSGGCLGDA
ncbi:KamA family radical SAM protein [Streptomyces stelliscabiei]|uniref:Lysine 2,3-aminomutase n=2 Tax=Streptomyces stelliscabiei TaxID=146820 RepID=A0A8I0P5U2_9ACTN|nr:lysine 2,3-aminomutase [Streptomyces stelliscabiei]MBE1596729.1 lysine 2,3-aminomutase [Streptomyces stelliscabiei]MDX2514535.1 lysine 2,3-aminomutase [Streptomyces stelliscabiei]MDX2551236.1 lysine 2,3-aminomutase [Streptomyces stelliscabiei]MDX2615298.1 lysine 2,3-aminomutase [Streptomyces stelliscabiei]MDX2633896.1 lysine 2,3-aminomutase [Streptomyces stelliscabiei]